jgi:hypothetical protein
VLRERHNHGQLDMEATEMAVRSSMHEAGGVVLEKLVNLDGGYLGPRVECRQGHAAEFVDYRSKGIITVVSEIQVHRAYYHCSACELGVIPKDEELDVVKTSCSPGVRRLMGHVGGKEAFEEGRRDLEELAGIEVKTKQVERVSERLGEQIEFMAAEERRRVLSGKLLPFESVATLYVAIDGTGVPMVPRETEGRAGKNAPARAKTREVKLGCIFTQTTVDDKGFPVRDEQSTTYVGAIETAEEFGNRIYAEAARRGLRRAGRLVVLGDGAVWIWNLVQEHFYGAIEVVDIYHARSHIRQLAKLVYGHSSKKTRDWTQRCLDRLDEGDVEGILGSMRRLRPKQDQVKEEVRRAIGYFETNKDRMRYSDFRQQALFIGSGVVEAGCKTIASHRLKQSGMRWTVRGANDIIALRCCQLSGRWEEFWEARSSA